MSFGLPYGLKQRNSEGKLRSINTINGERFVYYERLRTDASGEDDWRTKVYNKANSVLDWRISYGGNPQDISGYFKGLANYEFAKEKALLETHFRTSYDPASMECGQALIEAYNTILGVREVFERNALLIANTNQKDLVSFFPHYLDKALEEWISKADFSKEIDGLAMSGFVEGKDKSEKIAAAIEKNINDNIFKITEIALEKMFSSDTKAENGLKKKVGEEEFDRLGKAYKEIFDALKKLEGTAQHNQFIKGTIENYKLKDLGKMIANDITKNKKLNKSNIVKSMKGFKFETKIKSKQGILAGGFKEIFGIFNAEVTLSNKGTRVDSIHSGKQNVQVDQKADMIFMIGFDEGAAEAAQEKLNEFQGTGRGSNVGDIKKFTEEMFKDFGNDKGFMLFVNSKNYTLNWHFRNGYMDKDGSEVSPGGYSAGSAINLMAWDDMMHKMNVRGRDLIFTIMQLIPGAIGGEREDKEEVSDMFARAIGSALFDDFVPDDPYNRNNSNLRTIHLLYLNGVYIPLSVFYTLLSEAFGGLEDALDKNELIKVEFNLPNNILYPTQEDQNRSGEKHPWTVQSNAALNSITVTYHFLSGFQKFMKQFYNLNP